MITIAYAYSHFDMFLSVQSLTEKLCPLFSTIIHTRNIFTASSREKSWNEYHKQHHQLLSIITGFIENHQLSSFILLKTMEALLRRPEPEEQPQGLTQLSPDELDILV